MNAMSSALEPNPLFGEPITLVTILLLIILSRLLAAMPRPLPARATIALGSPHLVPLDPADAASASHLLGDIAAGLMTSLGRLDK